MQVCAARKLAAAKWVEHAALASVMTSVKCFSRKNVKPHKKHFMLTLPMGVVWVYQRNVMGVLRT